MKSISEISFFNFINSNNNKNGESSSNSSYSSTYSVEEIITKKSNKDNVEENVNHEVEETLKDNDSSIINSSNIDNSSSSNKEEEIHEFNFIETLKLKIKNFDLIQKHDNSGDSYNEESFKNCEFKELSETIIVNEFSEIIKSVTKVSNKQRKKKRRTNSHNHNHNHNHNSKNNKSIKIIETIEYKRGYFINSRGFKLVCQEWIPKNPKGIVVILHGYGDHAHTSLADDCKMFAKMGYASFIFDQQGHGMSEGLPAYIRDFEDLVEDSMLFISDIKFRFPNLKRFVYCCSMGGAVGLLVSLIKPEIFNGGLILLAPLIKLDEDMVPNPLVVSILKWISQSFPTLAIVPGENVLDRSIKDPQKRIEHATHPLTYKGRARLGTGLAILKVTAYLQEHLNQISVPLFIGHGSLDRVSNPKVSEELYSLAKSSDKTLKIYEGFWHGLTTDSQSFIIYNDILDWMKDRIQGYNINNVNSNNNNNNNHNINSNNNEISNNNNQNHNSVIGSSAF